MTVVHEIIYVLEAKLLGPHDPWTVIGWADKETTAYEEKQRREVANSATSYRVLPVAQIIPPR